MIQIAEGWVYHSRIGKAKNSFRYPIFYLRFNIAKESELKKILSKKFNFFSFDDKNYLSENADLPLEEEIKSFLKSNFNFLAEKVLLQTMPKMFGYGFNPINFWFCFKNNKIEAVLCEVNNTFGQKHFYWIHDSVAINENRWISANKEFHVSPFFPVSGNYQFKFEVNDESYKVDINYFDENQELKLATWVSGTYRPMEQVSQAKLVFKYGWITAFVILRIHYQALKLLFKGAKFYKLPTYRKTVITK